MKTKNDYQSLLNFFKIKGVELKKLLLLALIGSSVIITSCGGNQSKKNTEEKTNAVATAEPKIVNEQVTYTSGNDTLVGYLYYDENSNEKKPGIIVVHEWWGNNSYAQKRAQMLAELGYVALAADMYGNGKILDNPKDAQAHADVIYSNPDLLKARMMAAHQTLINSNRVINDQIAAIGYCFGGTVVLNAAAMGVPLDAVVSFHGGLAGFKATPALKNTHVLVCNGGADPFVTEDDIKNFKNEMNRENVPFVFKEYEGATHAFTNPESTEAGEKFNMPIAYNESADKASWQDMLDFFKEHFPVK